MRKAALAVALLLLVPQVYSQNPPAPTAGPGYYCGNTGFDVNLGVTTKTFRCQVVKMQRGVGTLTLNGTSTVTVSGSNFNVLVPPDALPGADGVFFKTSGLWYRFGASEFFLRVSAKASNSSITALAGAAGSANSGTTAEWGYWNTTCYRSASSTTTFNATTDHVDPRIWGYSNSFTDGLYLNALSSTLRTIVYTPAASAATNVEWAAKPRGMRILFGSSTIVIFTMASSGNAGEINQVTQSGNGASGTASLINTDIQDLVQTATSASYAVPIIATSN